MTLASLANALPPLPFGPHDPPFRIPEWEPVGMGVVPADMFVRHFGIFAETGAGKTRGGILPPLLAALRYGRDAGDPGLAPAMLVLDPKRELSPALLAADRADGLGRNIVHVGDDDRRFDLFEGMCGVRTPPEDAVARILSLSPEHAQEKRSQQPFFALSASRFLAAFVACDQAIACEPGVRGIPPARRRLERLRAFWCDVAHNVQAIGLSVSTAPLDYDAMNPLRTYLNLVTLASQAISAGMQGRRIPPVPGSAEPFEVDVPGVGAVLREYVRAARAYGVPAPVAGRVLHLGAMATDTFLSVDATLRAILHPLVSDAVTALVSLNPCIVAGRPYPVERSLSDGVVLCFDRGYSSPSEVIVARAIRLLHLEALFRRADRRRPFLYVADEAQAVLDPEIEPVFAALSRGYRGALLLATQSTAALAAALRSADHTGRGGSDDTLTALLNNLGTKMFGRSSDLATIDRVRALIPAAPGGRPHVLSVRPLSALSTGQAYVVRSDGGWACGQLGMVPPPVAI
jgi:hypothetical protein